MNQYMRSLALFLAFACLTTMALGMVQKASAGGPLTTNLLIRIFYDPTQEENALATGDIDMNDWPLSSTFITAHAADPAITMNEYAELGMMEYDINCQLWPTGPITSPRTGAKNDFFNPAGVRDIAALHFRRAIAHLTNKDKYTTTYMGGYGYVMQTMIPVPALEGFTDFSTLTNNTAVYDDPFGSTPAHGVGTGGYLYPFDRTAALAELELGGFHDWDGDTYREWSSDGGSTWEELPNMKVYIRLDDPNRRQAGEDLFNELATYAHIPVASAAGGPGLDKRIAERSSCFAAVMVAYDYNIYTGGWSVGADPDFLFDFGHSTMGQYAYANNYAGFKNDEYDDYAERVKYPKSLSDVRNAAIQAQWVMSKYIPIIHLWASKGVKGYRTGWDGAVNLAGFGTDNGWSFQQMSWSGKTTLKYGFKSDISALSVYTSEWLWDWNVLGLIYDTLIGRNPFNLPDEIGALATSWTATSTYPGWEGKTVCEFTVRTDATFHDGSPVKPADIAYSLLSVRDAGPGMAWNYPTVMDIDHIQIAGNVVRVFFGVESAFAVHWAGFMPIVNKDLWNQAIGLGTTAGYTGFIADNTDGTYNGGTYANPSAIRQYRIWESTAMGNAAVNDLAEDGSWIYKFVSYSVGNNVALEAFTGHYSTITWHGAALSVGTFVTNAFHSIGNVNYDNGWGENQGYYTPDEKVDSSDLFKIATSMPSVSTQPNWGTGQGDYNPDADVTGNLEVNVQDLATAGTNFNKKQG